MTPSAENGLPEGVIELERRIAAPAETVFAYFTDATRYRLWQGVDAELDPRPGGLFRVTMNDDGWVAEGRFLEVEHPKRVVFSWGWVGVDGLEPGESTVEVNLIADGADTLLRLRHSGLPSESACQIHTFGWTEGLDKLLVVTGAPTGR